MHLKNPKLKVNLVLRNDQHLPADIVQNILPHKYLKIISPHSFSLLKCCNSLISVVCSQLRPFDQTGSSVVSRYLCVCITPVLIQTLVALLAMCFEYLNLQQLNKEAVFFPWQRLSLLLVREEGPQPSPN